ncbi:MAG: ABC-three component system protein [Nitrospirales bacterium]
MTDDDRRHFDNLILLCDECHTIIDNKENEEKYTVSLLKDWKKRHESTATYAFLTSRPSLLMTVVDAIARIDMESTEKKGRSGGSFDINDKIKHNAVVRNRPLIEEYRVFYKKINSLYQTLEKEGSFKKENLMRNIRTLYLQVKGKYLDASVTEFPQDTVRENADNIIEDVMDELLLQTQGKTGEVTQEDVAFGLSVIVVDAFIRCKILEEPSINDH